uniref:Putative secreted protein n=1 Tax=Ixodes ricinus TaxID=34613 RepID=A0A6B0UK01_IXORI
MRALAIVIISLLFLECASKFTSQHKKAAFAKRASNGIATVRVLPIVIASWFFKEASTMFSLSLRRRGNPMQKGPDVKNLARNRVIAGNPVKDATTAFGVTVSAKHSEAALSA